MPTRKRSAAPLGVHREVPPAPPTLELLLRLVAGQAFLPGPGGVIVGARAGLDGGKLRLVRRDRVAGRDLEELPFGQAHEFEEQVQARGTLALVIADQLDRLAAREPLRAQVQRREMRGSRVPALQVLEVVAHPLQEALDLLVSVAGRDVLDLVSLPAQLTSDELRLTRGVPGDVGTEADRAETDAAQLPDRRVRERLHVAFRDRAPES